MHTNWCKCILIARRHSYPDSPCIRMISRFRSAFKSARGRLVELIRVGRWYLSIRRGARARSLQARGPLNSQCYSVIRTSVVPPNRRGVALLALVAEPFELAESAALVKSHSNYWKAPVIAGLLRSLGFSVDVTDWRNANAPSADDYDLVIGQGPAFTSSCRESRKTIPRIFLGWGLYGGATAANTEQRVKELWKRRGLCLPSIPDVDDGPLYATDIIYIGNRYTRSTYETVVSLPMLMVPNPATIGVKRTTDGKDFSAARRHFLWMAAYGTLRRGLDVLLEVFAANPEFQLTVCGDISHEKDFFAFYKPQLLESANIRYVGWVDVTSDIFSEVTTQCGFCIYPSVSDGMPGSVVNAMVAGLVPIVPDSAGMECGNLEFKVPSVGHESLLRTMRECAAMRPEDLRDRANAAADFAATFYTRGAFESRFKTALASILTRHGLESVIDS